jgi:hypothetical protein
VFSEISASVNKNTRCNDPGARNRRYMVTGIGEGGLRLQKMLNSTHMLRSRAVNSSDLCHSSL